MAAIEVAGVDGVVNQLRLLFVFAFHCSDSAFVFEPLANESKDVNSPGVGRVVKRFVLDVRAVVEHCRKSFGNTPQQIFAQDDHSQSAWSHVLLRTCIDHSIPIYIDHT